MSTRIHWSFWLIGIVALLWHGGSVLNLYMQLNPEMLQQMPQSHRSIVESRPFWVTTAFAISALTGTLGAIALLCRHRISGPLFFLSFIGAVIATLHAVAVGGALQKFSGVEVVLAIIGPVVFGAYLVWFVRKSVKRAWMRGSRVSR